MANDTIQMLSQCRKLCQPAWGWPSCNSTPNGCEVLGSGELIFCLWMVIFPIYCTSGTQFRSPLGHVAPARRAGGSYYLGRGLHKSVLCINCAYSWNSAHSHSCFSHLLFGLLQLLYIGLLLKTTESCNLSRMQWHMPFWVPYTSQHKSAFLTCCLPDVLVL